MKAGIGQFEDSVIAQKSLEGSVSSTTSPPSLGVQNMEENGGKKAFVRAWRNSFPSRTSRTQAPFKKGRSFSILVDLYETAYQLSQTTKELQAVATFEVDVENAISEDEIDIEDLTRVLRSFSDSDTRMVDGCLTTSLCSTEL